MVGTTGIGIAIILMSAIGGSVLMLSAMGGPQPGGNGPQTCDLAGTVSGTVTDIVLVPVFTNWNVELTAVDCRETTAVDSFNRWLREIANSFAPDSVLPQAEGALIQVGGPYHIQVKVYDDRFKLLGESECRTFTTGVTETVKSFSFPISFSNFEKGQRLIVNAYSECSDSAGIAQTFDKTV